MVSDNGFQLLSHTADMRMRVWGKTLEELFRNALGGVAFYLKPETAESDFKGERERRPLEIKSVDINTLLVDFLSEVLAQSDIHNIVFTGASFEEFGENFLSGMIAGIKVDGFDKDIKAVSYHEVEIKKNPKSGNYETVLVFDI